MDFEFKTEGDLPLVSGVVAAWNEAENIDAFIKSFQKLDYQNKELILIAGGDDDTFKKALEFESDSIIVLKQNRGDGKVFSVKKGLEKTNGSIIYLTDADCLLSTESFLSLIYPIVRNEEKLVTGQVKPFSNQFDNPLVYSNWCRRKVQTACSESLYSHSIVGANYAAKKKILERLIHKIPNQTIGEDHHLALLAQSEGNEILNVRNSFVETHFPENLKDYINQQTRWHKTWLRLNFKFKKPELKALGIGIFKSLIIATLPIFYFFIGPIALVLCLLGILFYAVPYFDIKLKINQLNRENELTFWGLMKLMIGDIVVHCLVIPQLLFSRTKNKW